MKFIFTPLFVFFALFVFGQYDHNIQLTNGQTIIHNTTAIDSITFSTDGAPALELRLNDGSMPTYALDAIDVVSFSGEPAAPTFPEGAVFCNPEGEPTAVVDVLNPATGKIWMDRNLGATQAATDFNDQASYGDLYQWGRFSDGHQCRNSPTTTVTSSSDIPDHGDFIVVATFIPQFDWRNPQNNELWQGVQGTNNPCPQGYRLPTNAEWSAERGSWSSDNRAGAFDSPLRLPAAGDRDPFNNGGLFSVGFSGRYWSGTPGNINAIRLSFAANNASTLDDPRSYGLSVRCIKN